MLVFPRRKKLLLSSEIASCSSSLYIIFLALTRIVTLGSSLILQINISTISRFGNHEHLSNLENKTVENKTQDGKKTCIKTAHHVQETYVRLLHISTKKSYLLTTDSRCSGNELTTVESICLPDRALEFHEAPTLTQISRHL